jgi:hypothetical protein
VSADVTGGKYTIELCRAGGFHSGIEGTIASEDNLGVARELYKHAVANNPDRVELLCDRARVLARSDRPETMPRRSVGHKDFSLHRQ